MDRHEMLLRIWEKPSVCSVEEAKSILDNLLSDGPKICVDGHYRYKFFFKDKTYYLSGTEENVDAMVSFMKQLGVR